MRERGHSRVGDLPVLVVLFLLSFGGIFTPLMTVLTSTAQSQTGVCAQGSTFTSPNAVNSGRFGSSVAVSGSTVVIGAPDEYVGELVLGHAYVCDATTGNLIAALTEPNSPSASLFGQSVAISGSTVVVGAGDFAYIFDTNGTLIATLTDPSSQYGSLFGQSVAVSGSTVVVGAPNEGLGPQALEGQAYVFDTAGALISTLASPNPVTYGYFGTSVAVSGSTVVVGAPGETAGGQVGAGQAYVFNTAGSLTVTLTNPSPRLSGAFGQSVAIGGPTIVVGAPFATPYEGQAYVFNTAGSLTATLTSPNPQVTGEFGQSVAMSGAIEVVGDPGLASGGVGQVCIFNAAGSLTSTLASPNAQTGGRFGISVAISGSTVIVGAPGENAGVVSGAGQAYLFVASTTTTSTTTTSTTTSTTTITPRVTFAASPLGAGLTSPSGTFSYAVGSMVPITATPGSGFQFASWTANTTSITFTCATCVSTTATIGGKGTVTANFVQLPPSSILQSCNANAISIASTSCTLSTPVTAGDLLIVEVSDVPPITVSDSLGDSFALLSALSLPGSTYYLSFYYTTVRSSGTDTVTMFAGGNYPSIVVHEMTPGTGLGIYSTGQGTSASPAVSPYSVPTNSFVLAVMLAQNSALSASAGPGYALIGQYPGILADEDAVVSGTTTSQFTTGASAGWAEVSVAFTQSTTTTTTSTTTTTTTSATISTSLSAASIVVGGSVFDTATLSGSAGATGTIAFYYYSDGACSAGQTQVGSPVSVSGNGRYSSVSQLFTAAGSYSWNAAYSGDANNSPATSQCEPLTVTLKSSPTLSTSLFATAITVGNSDFDNAILSGSSNAAGTISFVYFTNGGCSGTPAPVGSPVPVSGDGTYQSALQTFTASGSYGWEATYSGDSNNPSVTSSCEPMAVSAFPATITITQIPQPTIVNGQQIVTMASSVTFTATVTGGSQTPTGEVTWSASGAGGGGLVIPTSCPLSVSGGSSSCSVTYYAPLTTGPVDVLATYGGDGAHAGSSTTTSLVVVATTSVAITENPPPNPVGGYETFLIGNSITFTATVASNSLVRAPTGTVDWSANGANAGFAPTSCVLRASGTFASLSSCSVTYQAPSKPGPDVVVAKYAGDEANAGSSFTTSFAVVSPNPQLQGTPSITDIAGNPISGNVGFGQPYQIRVSISNPNTISYPFALQVVEESVTQSNGNPNYNWPPVVKDILGLLGLPTSWPADPRCQVEPPSAWASPPDCVDSKSVTLQPGQTYTLKFNFTNEWAWIPSWDPSYLVSSALWTVLNAKINDLARVAEELNDLQQLQELQQVQGLLKVQSDLGYATAAGSILPFEGFNFEVQSISPSGTNMLGPGLVNETIASPDGIAKLASYVGSVIVALPAGGATEAGLAACGTVVLCPEGAGAFIFQALSIAAQNIEYNAAADPSQDFTQVVQPTPPTLLNGTQVTQLPVFRSLSTNMKGALQTMAGVVEYDNATAISFARYEGAKLAESQTYEAIQLQAMVKYAQERDALMVTLEGQSSAISSPFPALNSSLMQKATNYLEQNGLPPVERQILSGLGLSATIQNATSGMLMLTETDTALPSLLTGLQEWHLAQVAETNSALYLASASGQSITVADSFTAADNSPLPTDASGNPALNVTLRNNFVVSTQPGIVLAQTNVTNTGTVSLNSLKINTTLPSDWQVTPAWFFGGSAIRVYYRYANGALVDITGSTRVSVSNTNHYGWSGREGCCNGSAETVIVSIPSLNATTAHRPLTHNTSILVRAKLTYDLVGSVVNATSYPITYPDNSNALAWKGRSYTNSNATQEESSFFIAYLTLTPTSTDLSCNPWSVKAGATTHCKAEVDSWYGSTPTGTVTFTSSDSHGKFGKATCASYSGGDVLASDHGEGGGFGGALTCKVDYTASSSAAQNITATYSGDATHYPSSDTFQLNGGNGHGGGHSIAQVSSPSPLVYLMVPSAAIVGIAFSGQTRLRALTVRRGKHIRTSANGTVNSVSTRLPSASASEFSGA